MSEKSYFSINYDLLSVETKLGFDLYVNASATKKQKFVKVFLHDEDFTQEDLDRLKEKYRQVYLEESQRSFFLKSLVKSDTVDDVQAMDVIKDSAMQYLHGIFDSEKDFSTELLSETIRGCRDTVEGMIDVLDDHDIESLRGLIGNLSGHDFYTYDHSINVSMYCITVLRTLKPSASRVELMHAGLGGLLHDLGKVKISTSILNSPTGLTDEEFLEIKKHPDYGIELLGTGDVDCDDDIDLKIIARVIHEHHENWDGTGYPNKIEGKDIHLLARVCTIADFFDAITTKRSYNEVLTVSQAINVMEKSSGKKLDPKIFKIFANYVKYSKIQSPKELQMSDSFDPAVPYAKLPLEEFVEEKSSDFGKIKFLDGKDKKGD